MACSEQCLTENQCFVAVVVVNMIIDIRDNMANERGSHLEVKHNDPHFH